VLELQELHGGLELWCRNLSALLTVEARRGLR
jgi:hypothetical protein